MPSRRLRRLDAPLLVSMASTGPYAGGVRGVRTPNRHISGGGPRRCMRLHGAWPPCMAVASGRAVVGFKLARLLFRRLNMHMKSYVEELVKPSPKTAAHHRANFIDKKVSNVVLEFFSH